MKLKNGGLFRRGCFKRASGGPVFSALPEKTGEKRGAGYVWCILRVQFRQVSDLQLVRTHKLTLRTLWYAPSVAVQQICEQLRLNHRDKSALRLYFGEAIRIRRNLVVRYNIKNLFSSEALVYFTFSLHSFQVVRKKVIFSSIWFLYELLPQGLQPLGEAVK